MSIDENYTLENDSNNWILSYESEKKVNDKGNEYTSKDQWYFSSIQQALKKYCDQSLKASTSVNELIMNIQDLEHKIEGIKQCKC